MDYKRYLDAAIFMAKMAGEPQLTYFRTPHLSVETKSNEYDVVTIADKASEKEIKDYIHINFPEHGIISEESVDENSENEWRWVIDPLDGTTNFSQGLPIFSVSIALQHYKETVIGVVFAPYLKELFYAVKGEGAYFNGERIRCSSKNSLAESVFATGVPYDKLSNSDNNLKELNAIIPKVRGIRRLGSAAMDLCYVAAGFLDGYWELSLNIWDVAAGMLIAEEAGAELHNIRASRKYSIMAANPNISPLLLNLLTNIHDS